ncbi:hypothetical protein [Achromobacter sp. DH1f]|uniref:hypothetical protein n=1 Tax=Achromobacter sp. DH1f TaxID=1397275 RepID=UPI0004696A45|nr:hypothetical protein [Achromobacter sp. DH1f]
MPVRFPYGPVDYTVPDSRFIAAWDRWFAYFDGDANRDPQLDGMPISNAAVGLAEQMTRGRIFSLDVLCRLLVPYRNTMQATREFRTSNAHLLVEYSARHGTTGRHVNHVRLSDEGQKLWASLSSKDRDDIDALIAADIEDSGKGLIDVGLPGTEIVPFNSPRAVAAIAEVSVQALTVALVDAIDQDPFVAHYRGKPTGTPAVTGWSARLQGYFWPNPGVDARVTGLRLRPMLEKAAVLQSSAMQGRAWTEAEGVAAVQLAKDIFQWGGVPQPDVTVRKVRAVFDSVNRGERVGDALMNSGWTKVAAFASAACGSGCEQVIWDSRVAHSLLRRLDAILVASGVEDVPDCLVNLGRVPGRAGTRVAPRYRLNWPNGYQKWSTQFAGSAFVRGVRDELNRRPDVYPVGPANEGAVWTTREVEMVLFMDGY